MDSNENMKSYYVREVSCKMPMRPEGSLPSKLGRMRDLIKEEEEKKNRVREDRYQDGNGGYNFWSSVKKQTYGLMFFLS